MTSFLLKTVLFFIFLQHSLQYGSIDPLIPTKLSVLNSGLSAIYTFTLSFHTFLQPNNYLMINFTNYSEPLSPNSCFYSIYPNFPNTLTTCSVPNSDNILFILIPISISSTSAYTFIIGLTNPNPISSMGSGLELKTVSSTDITSYFVYDYNPNFESIPYNISSENMLVTSLIGFDDVLNYNLPNQQVKISIAVKINVDLFENPRIKLVLTSPWNFKSENILSVLNDPKYITLFENDATKSDYKAPSLLSFTIESPLEAYLVFNEDLKKGRSFVIEIRNFLNPSKKSSIFLKIYTMSYNTNSAIEYSENSLQLETLQNPLIVSLGLASKIPLVSNTPGSFYKNSKQYIQVNITSTKITPDNLYVKLIIGSTNEIVKGSVSLTGFIAYDNSLPLSLIYSTNTLKISNVKSIIAKTMISVTMRIRTSSVDSSMFAIASFDTNSESSIPAFSGQSSLYYFQSNAYSIISSFTLSMDPANTFQFQITPSSDDTTSNSFLEIYFSRFIKFTGNPICHITTIINCTLVNYGNYYYLKLISHIGTNMFPNSVITVSIGGFVLSDCSNYKDKLYEFYFGLNFDSLSAVKLFIMLSALAIPTRNTLSNFYQSISNDLCWTTFNYNYPSILNLVGTSAGFSAITLPTGSKRIISVFSYKNFKNLFGSNLVSNSSFPCGSNLQITCIYIEGDSQSYLTSTYFLDWDRVNIYLPDTISSDFHIILPDIYQFLTYTYETYIGTVTSSSEFTYQYLETQLTYSPVKTFSTNYINTALQIQNSGFAAAQINNFKLEIYTSTSHRGNGSPNFASALFIITNWELWVEGISSSTGTAFGTLLNAAVNLHFIGGDNFDYYLLYIPLINTAHLNAGLVSYLNEVFNPFTLDLPNYVIYLTKRSGAFDTYNSFFNSGANSYSSNQLKALALECTDFREGEKNTFCTITFQTNNRISANGNLRLQATGLTFHTNLCYLSYLKGMTTYEISGFTCEVISSADDILNVALSFNSVLSNSNVKYFNLSFVGVDIDTNASGSVLIDFSVRDFSSNYIMENLKKAFPVLPPLLRFNTITAISLEYYNPGSVTKMNITTNFPRNLYSNEKIVVDIGEDLLEKNQISDTLQVSFYNYVTMDPIIISVSVHRSLMTLTLNNPTNLIKAGTYIVQINGIKLPLTTPESFFSIYFMRTIDKIITLSSYENSTTSFPQLLGNDKPNLILLESKYLLEGHLGEYVFQITILSSSLDYQTIIYMNFPEFFSPSLYNDNAFLYCGIGNLKVSCEADVLFPYRLKLTNFPTFLYAGSTFNITVYGIVNPKYLNRISTKYVNSTIMVGVDQFKNGSFSEIANLLPPTVQPLPNPFSYLILMNVFVDNLVVKDFGTHIFQLLLKELAITAHLGYLINFASQYTSLENLENIQCEINYIDNFGTIIIASEKNSCSVKGKRIKGYFENSISQNTLFNITLYNVPTPESLIKIDSNKFLISIFDSTEIQILTYTKYQMNSAKPISFTNKELDIDLNNGKQLVLTQGTYSPLIKIMPSNGSRFVNNLLLNPSLTGFSFNPSSLSILLGDFSSNFQIGVDRDLINGVYSFSFQKKELGFQNIYKDFGTIYLFLTTNPIKITVPDQIIVNYFGCNLPYLINITSTPYFDLILNFMLDYDAVGETFFVDDQLNSYSSIFLSNNSLSNLAFCTNEQFDMSINSTIIYLSLTGFNSDSYYLSNSQINVVFQNKSRTNPPIIDSSINFIERTSVSLTINVNCDGLVFWRLVSAEYNSKNLTAEEIRRYLLQRNFTETRNQSNNYDDGPSEIFNYLIVYNNTVNKTINNTLTIDGLIPAKEYEFFGYARNEFRDMGSNFTYVKFETKYLQNLTKIIAIYNRTLYEDEINNFYCYLVRKFETKSYLIVSSEGTSCSFVFKPISYHFQYTGQSFSYSSNQTNLYFIPDPEMEQDSAIEKINAYFNLSSKLASDDILNGGGTYGIDFLKNLQLIRQFNQSLLNNAETPFKVPSLLNVSFGVFTSKYNSSILIKNLTLSEDGAVYFIMEPSAKTLEDSDFPGDYYNDTIKSYRAPTGDQIKNCLNYLDQKAHVCFRVYYYNSTSIDVEIRLVESYTVYKVFYMIANENPIFPVYKSSQVYETEALSYTIFGEKLWWNAINIMIFLGIILNI